jgi:hypothetical protein
MVGHQCFGVPCSFHVQGEVTPRAVSYRTATPRRNPEDQDLKLRRCEWLTSHRKSFVHVDLSSIFTLVIISCFEVHYERIYTVSELSNGLENRDSIPGRGRKVIFSFSLPRPCQLWVPPSLLSSGYRGPLSSGLKWPLTSIHYRG